MRQAPRFDPTTKSFVADPYPLYRRLRDEDPFHRSSLGAIILTRYEHVKSALEHPCLKVLPTPKMYDLRKPLVAAKGGSLETLAELSRRFLMYQDAPEHTAWREIIVKAFRSVSSASLRTMIREEVTEAFDKMPEGEDFDFVKSLGLPIPCRVIMQIIGAPPEDIERLYPSCERMIRVLDPLLSLEQLAELDLGICEFQEYFRELIHSDRISNEPCVLRSLLEIRDSFGLSETDLIGVLILLFVTGQETAALALTNAADEYSQRASLRSQLQNDLSLVSGLTQEFLRYDAPVQFTGRLVAEPFQMDGFHFKKGEAVTLCLGSANRDERKYPNPDELIPDRDTRGALSFGDGIHRCLGASVALLEMQEFLTQVAQRKIKFSPGEGETKRHHAQVLRGYQNLSLRASISL